MDRREFLRLGAGVTAAAALGPACGSGSSGAKPARSQPAAAGKGGRTLRIAQWSHTVPEYDRWFDDEYCTRWGDEHGVTVVVDHISFGENTFRAEAEVAARGPHDIYGFIDPPSVYEDHAIDHRELVDEITAKLGPMIPLVERSVRNAKTGKVFGCPHYWVANPSQWRTDLWQQAQPGSAPTTWDDLLRVGPKLKALGHPLGIGYSQEGDSNYSLIGMLHSYGASLQDEAGVLTINRPATIEAVKMGAAIYKTSLTDDVFAWDGFSNNRALADGKASLILNAVSAIRAVELQDAGLAGKVALAPFPTAGGTGRERAIYVLGVNVIWEFSPNQDLAKQFLVDLASVGQEAFARSGFYNLPPFQGAAPDVAKAVSRDDRANPADKYALLAEATKWSTNAGHPGPANAAVMEIFNRYLVPKMFAAAARGEMTAEEAVKAAEAQMQPIFAKWREQGRI